MFPVPRCSVLCLVALVAACGGQGTDLQDPPSSAPVAAFGTVCTDLTCTFSDSSSDAGGTIVSHQWTFGDGGEADAPSPDHTYASAGVYSVQLVVADDRGDTATVEQQVTVTAPAPPPPSVIASSDSAIGFCLSPGSTRNCVVLEEHVLITSVDGQARTLTVVSDQPWIVVQPASGTTPLDVKVSVDRSRLPPRGDSKIVNGTITVTARGTNSTEQLIPVKLQYYSSPPPR